MREKVGKILVFGWGKTTKMLRKIVVLENLRSAYNVGNVLRTAAFLGWEVWLVGYTPSPSALQK